MNLLHVLENLFGWHHWLVSRIFLQISRRESSAGGGVNLLLGCTFADVQNRDASVLVLLLDAREIAQFFGSHEFAGRGDDFLDRRIFADFAEWNRTVFLGRHGNLLYFCDVILPSGNTATQ